MSNTFVPEIGYISLIIIFWIRNHISDVIFNSKYDDYSKAGIFHSSDILQYVLHVFQCIVFHAFLT